MTTSPTLDAFISDEAAIKEMLLRRTGRHARRIVAIIPAYQEAKVIANTIAKAAYAAIVGRGAFSGHFLLASSAALAAGLTVFVLTPAFSV